MIDFVFRTLFPISLAAAVIVRLCIEYFDVDPNFKYSAKVVCWTVVLMDGLWLFSKLV